MEVDAPKRKLSTRRAHSRPPGTVRTKSRPHDAGAPQPSTSSFSDDQSLTSFPSLSPSLENSPLDSKDLLSNPPALGAQLLAAQNASARIPSALDGLFEPNGSPQARPNLFEDAPTQSRDVPGTIHHQSDRQIEHLISRVGQVKLVKQLSEDLAQRDLQVTAIQRRAEERESLLRKMLRECEVSNLDIENRLRELEKLKPATRGQSLFPGTTSGRLQDASNDSSKLNDQMSEALSDNIGSQEASMIASDSRAGVRETDLDAPRKGSTQSQTPSQPGSEDTKAAAGATRTWKDYFKYGAGTAKPTSSKANLESTRDDPLEAQRTARSDRFAASRQRLSSDIFRAPSMERQPSATESLQEHLLAVSKTRDQSPSAHSSKSNTSVSSWAARFIGAGKSTSDIGHRTKSASISGDVRTTNESMRKQALRAQTPGLGISNADTVQHSRAGSMTSIGPNGTIKLATAPDALKSAAPPFMPDSPSGSIDSGMATLGPVEMDAILPNDDSRPPVLSINQSLETADGVLTDRYGFIFNQNRRKRQDQAAQLTHNSNEAGETLESATRSLNAAAITDAAESFPSAGTSLARPGSPVLDEKDAKAWAEHLNVSNTADELLSHTPAAAPMTSITTADSEEGIAKAVSITMSKRGSEPAAGLVASPSAVQISCNHAELAPPASNAASFAPNEEGPQPQDPVKALLEHLTNVHDGLQKDREARWNEFLRKVRAERSKNGDTTTNTRRNRGFYVPEALIADGEFVGVAGLANKGKAGRAKWLEFRSLVLGGVPTSLRSRIWSECSGASSIRIPGYFEELINSQSTDASIANQIDMDITRTLTDNIYFRRGQGIQRLREVLLAYSKRNPEIGYCQGMNLIAANLLLIMPTAEDAFWVLASMIERMLPEKYYDSSLLASKADQTVLRQYVREIMPTLSKHFESLSVELEAFTFQWFLSVFTDCLSAEALFRVWDVVLCINDGSTFLFQVALALLKLNEKQLLAMSSTAEVYAYISQHMTDHAISIDALIRASEGLRKVVKREDTLVRRKEAVQQELEQIAQREEIRQARVEAVRQKRANLEAVTPGAMSTEVEESSSAVATDSPDESLGSLEESSPMPIDDR